MHTWGIGAAGTSNRNSSVQGCVVEAVVLGTIKHPVSCLALAANPPTC